MPKLYTQIAHNVIPSAGGIGPVESTDNIVLEATGDTLTATPAGTQTTALLLTKRYNRVTVVANAADAVRLPPALAGVVIVISNANANAIDVFPASAAQGGATGGDAINALSQNTAYSQATGRQTFVCYTAGTWETA